jgi:hypothetical protein
MPDAIAATLHDGSDETAAAARAATGADGWYEWCTKHWGTKWNSSGYQCVAAAPGLHGAYFDTAWNCPDPIFRALAAAFPRLHGTVFAVEEMMEWGLVGSIGEGVCSRALVEISPELESVIYGWMKAPRLGAVTSRALAEAARNPLPSGADTVAGDRFLAQIWSRLCLDLPPEFGRRLRFRHHVRRYLEWQEACDDAEGDEKPSLDGFVDCKHDRAFLAAAGRCRTPLDGALMDAWPLAWRPSAGIRARKPSFIRAGERRPRSRWRSAATRNSRPGPATPCSGRG